MFNLVIFGPPGAGKGTQSAKIIDKYKLAHISTGDMFRMHISQNTALGQKVKQILADGLLVPDSITIDMLEEEVQNNPDATGFIFDGFPRTVAQAKALDIFLEGKNDVEDTCPIVPAFFLVPSENLQLAPIACALSSIT